MRSTRRALLGLAAALPGTLLAACSPSPVITGGPSAPFSPIPTEPVQSEAAAEAARWVQGLADLVRGAPAADADWASAVLAQCEEHLSRLNTVDPLVDGLEPVFAPTPPPPALEADFGAALANLADGGTALFGRLVETAETQPERLLHASLMASAAGLTGPRALPPVAGGAGPIRFPDTTPGRSVQVALSHVFALIHGLEVGLGRLAAGDARDRAGRRLGDARRLRNGLRAAAVDAPPEQEVAYELPNPMTTQEEIGAALATLELRVLDGLARLVASGDDGDPWRAAVVQQVAQVHAWGGRLPHWPGWAEV